jgi:hypothetical protein
VLWHFKKFHTDDVRAEGSIDVNFTGDLQITACIRQSEYMLCCNLHDGNDKETQVRERTVLDSIAQPNEHTFSWSIRSDVRVQRNRFFTGIIGHEFWKKKSFFKKNHQEHGQVSSQGHGKERRRCQGNWQRKKSRMLQRTSWGSFQVEEAASWRMHALESAGCCSQVHQAASIITWATMCCKTKFFLKDPFLMLLERSVFFLLWNG